MPVSNRFDPVRLGLAVAFALTALPLAAFFGFVGFMKATALIGDLAQYHAWTLALPEWVGRLVGVSEILCAAGLLVAIGMRGGLVWAEWIAGVLVVNQIAAATVHWTRGETAQLQQNAILIAVILACGAAAHLWRRRARVA